MKKADTLWNISIRLAAKTDGIRQIRQAVPLLWVMTLKHTLTWTAWASGALLLSCNAQFHSICSVHQSFHPSNMFQFVRWYGVETQSTETHTGSTLDFFFSFLNTHQHKILNTCHGEMWKGFITERDVEKTTFLFLDVSHKTVRILLAGGPAQIFQIQLHKCSFLRIYSEKPVPSNSFARNWLFLADEDWTLIVMLWFASVVIFLLT